jgi:hypothetical protein
LRTFRSLDAIGAIQLRGPRIVPTFTPVLARHLIRTIQSPHISPGIRPTVVPWIFAPIFSAILLPISLPVLSTVLLTIFLPHIVGLRHAKIIPPATATLSLPIPTAMQRPRTAIE